MQNASLLSDSELLARMPVLVMHERAGTADVIEHLVEVDRRDLYLGQACSSLSAYCRERLGYSEDEASKRVRVARAVRAIPEMLDELRAGRIHLTGLFVVSHYATAANAGELLAEARGKTRRELERALAARFPKADVAEKITPQVAGGAEQVAGGCAEQVGSGDLFQSKSGRMQPLSATSFAVQFTASVELHAKIERAKELLSHSIADGDLARVIERAMDALIAQEERRRMGAGQSRKRRALREGSRHVPVEIARRVWERDGGQCTFVDAEGRRCSERRFATIEHRFPFALGGTSLDVDNLCLLCGAHNHYTARQAYGTQYIARKVRERTRTRRVEDVESGADHDAAMREQVLGALCGMGFRRKDACAVLAGIASGTGSGARELLREAMQRLTPDLRRA
jgi:hypothetical protein